MRELRQMMDFWNRWDVYSVTLILNLFLLVCNIDKTTPEQFNVCFFFVAMTFVFWLVITANEGLKIAKYLESVADEDNYFVDDVRED